MAMQTVFYVQLTRYEDDPDGPLNGGFSLRPDLESAFDAVRNLSARHLPHVTDKRILEIKITVYKAEHVRESNRRILKMMLSLGFPFHDQDWIDGLRGTDGASFHKKAR